MLPTVIDAFDRTDPHALINRVPAHLQAALIDAQQKCPEIFGLDERELYREMRGHSRTPSPSDNRIRLAFWMEHDRALQEGCSMELARVYGGILSKQNFHGNYLNNPWRVAWMITPVVEYEIKMREALDFGLDRLRAFLDEDPKEGGKLNIKLMELQTKIVAMLDMRIKGGHTQRVEQRNLSVNLNTSDKQVANAVSQLSMEALEKRLKELDRKEKAILGPAEIEVTDE